MTHVKVAPSPTAGLGLFAAIDIPAGGRILAVDDGDIVTPQRPLRPEIGEIEDHCDMVAGGRIVYLRGPEKHINHSCDPNAYCKVIDSVRWVVARRPIAAGEQITTDYCVNSAMPEVRYPCACGSARCRGFVQCDFFALPSEFQSEYLPLLDDWFVSENRARIDDLVRSLRPVPGR